LGIVTGARRLGRLAGRAIDEDDRQVLAQAMVLVTGAGAVILTTAGVLGLAWRLFAFAAGIGGV
jgi:hypothetical protein